ncbi:MAG: hypothetical protein Fur0020_12200 [Thermodesulfovibrionia bacterium]
MNRFIAIIGITVMVMVIPMVVLAEKKATAVKYTQSVELQKRLKQWKEGSPSERLNALFWIKDNVLRQGMTKKDVEGILGKPQWIWHDGSWGYRAGDSGIWVSFKNDRVTNIRRFGD